MKNQLFYYKGAIHIHSQFSDGTGNISEIAKAAKKAGLDWIIITDHNSLDIDEGIIDGVCVIRGEEISPEFSNHYLALGIKNCIFHDTDAQKYINEVRNQGGFGFAAHPDESNFRKNSAKPIKWTDKSIVPDGVEIWNWFSDWADNYDDTNILKIAYAYLFRHNLIGGPHLETLKWWDDLNKNSTKIIPAIGGVDAHALKIFKYLVPVTIFPYKMSFKTLTNIITLNEKIPENFEDKKRVILNSLRDGNNIIINRHVKDEIPIINIKEKTIFIKLSQTSNIKILRYGEYVYDGISKDVEFKIVKSGKYRIEIYLKGKPWIYSNPIMVD